MTDPRDADGPFAEAGYVLARPAAKGLFAQARGGVEMATSTRGLIMESLMKLLDERPMNRVTVKDIVEDCGINRNTFYYHFAGMPELVEAIVREEAELIMQEYHGISSLQECLDTAMNVCVNHKRALLNIYNSANRDIYERYLLEISEYVVRAFVANTLSGKVLNDEDREAIIMGYKCECFGLVINWLSHGMNEQVRNRLMHLCELRQSMAQQYLQGLVDAQGVESPR